VSDGVERTSDEITFYHHSHEGITYSLLFSRSVGGKVSVEMYESGGVGPDTWERDVESYQGLSLDDRRQLAEWLTPPPPQEARVSEIADHATCPRCKGSGSVPLNGAHQSTLDLLRKKGRVAVSTLARKQRISVTTANMRLCWLEDNGFATRAREGKSDRWIATPPPPTADEI